MFSPVDPKKPFAQTEHEVLEFWEKEKIFEESVNQRKGKKKYVFYDGPPFANGLPHYGHILAGALKDAVTRYWTMKGYYLPRVNGWDCHGLPVEYEIEKELKLSGKKDIEKMGVAKFNAACRQSVFRYTEEWENLMRRMARWVDFDNGYATLENDYMESIWWVFKQIWDKNMVYQNYKSMHICPRCETPLSNFEVTQGYKDISDLSVVAKFQITDETFLAKYGNGLKTSFIAWTTTPWSIPTTMGLAVGAEFEYLIFKINDEQIICAKNRLEFATQNLKKEEFEVVKEVMGSEIVNVNYKHPFSIYKDHPDVKHNDKAYMTHGTDYVSVDDGTGIVTINGAFGEIDMEAAQKIGLPIVVNVKSDGTYDETMAPLGLENKPVKPSDDTSKMDQKIAQYLEENGALYRRDRINHSYPHCWRCDTPLLNYATQAWFIKVTRIKDKLLKNNAKIKWVPEHIKDGRFGKWLEGARDWNISRNRFWGAPMPIWECECGEKTCIGSLKELREQSRGGNTFYIIRHGEAEQNKKNIINSDLKNTFHLTNDGEKQAEKTAKKLKEYGVDMLISSQFPRAIETAEIIGEEIGINYTVENRLREHELGTGHEGASIKDYIRSYADLQERYYKKFEGGESFEDVEKRAIEVINYLNKKHTNKKIAIVTHGNVVRAIARYFDRLSIEETFEFNPGHAGIYEYRAGKLPLREDKLDLHKPYIDEIELDCQKCGGAMKRITEVLDCWFESGAMPYAQLHYPFENKKEFEENFPANFIAEGLDQTRGWFYTLHVISTILFDQPAFKNIIVNGILLAANGEKLSKRKKNYPDPQELFEKHGVDSTRFFLYTSTAPIGEDVRFSEQHVEDLVKKFTLTLWNTYSFFVTYASIDNWEPPKKAPAITNSMDRWIISEINSLLKVVTEQMDGYNFTKATRPMIEFVDLLSNWYVRRSRRRFWKSENDQDKSSAYYTLHYVLTKFSLILAPFAPMIADAIYKNLTGEKSVHLADWPTVDKKLIDNTLNEEIRIVRTIVSLALSLRAKHKVKVRQPLAKLVIALPQGVSQDLINSYSDVILEELNVKTIEFEVGEKIATTMLTVDARKIGPRFGKDTQKIIAYTKSGNFIINPNKTVSLPAEKPEYELEEDDVTIGFVGREGFDVESEQGILVCLDTTLTLELEQEGIARDLVRQIQDLRKKAGYDVSDRIYLIIDSETKVSQAIDSFREFIKKETLALELQEGGAGEWDKQETFEIDGEKVSISIKK